VPLALLAQNVVGDSMPNMPFTESPVLFLKTGDAGVHLAGAAAFALAFGERNPRTGESWTWVRRGLFWVALVLGAAGVLARSRGGFMAVAVAVAIVAASKPWTIGRRLLAAAAVALVLGGPTIYIMAQSDRPAEVANTTSERAFSPSQMIANLVSVWNPEVDAALNDTRQWRVEWWNRIFDYTVRGPYFWTGKGFGINLADDDGFQVSDSDTVPLRSPHSVHLSVLARMGVPGALLWILLQASFGLGMLMAYLGARRAGAEMWASLDLWLLAYWAAFLVNGSFDVFLEGPQGGIWFWTVFGAGLAALAVQRGRRTPSPAVSQ
jgi:O-antigen ligase